MSRAPPASRLLSCSSLCSQQPGLHSHATAIRPKGSRITSLLHLKPSNGCSAPSGKNQNLYNDLKELHDPPASLPLPLCPHFLLSISLLHSPAGLLPVLPTPQGAPHSKALALAMPSPGMFLPTQPRAHTPKAQSLTPPSNLCSNTIFSNPTPI